MSIRRSVCAAALIAVLTLALSACRPVQAPAGEAPSATEEMAAEATEEMAAEASTEEASTEEAAAGEAAAVEGLNEVTVTAVEYSLTLPESVPAGWTRFTLQNQGQLEHDFELFRIEEGKTLDDVMAALEAEGPPEWATFHGSTAAAAGESNWFVANLGPGSYVYLSFGNAEEGPPDAAQGMIGNLTVTEAEGSVADDAAIETAIGVDVGIEMVDFQFVVSGTPTAGEQVVRFSNTGTELHEVLFFKLFEGKTMADFTAMLEREMAGEVVEDSEIPVDYVDSFLLSPGHVSYRTINLESGDYVLVCFISSPANEMMPHAALGMVQQMTVE